MLSPCLFNPASYDDAIVSYVMAAPGAVHQEPLRIAGQACDVGTGQLLAVRGHARPGPH